MAHGHGGGRTFGGARSMGRMPMGHARPMMRPIVRPIIGRSWGFGMGGFLGSLGLGAMLGSFWPWGGYGYGGYGYGRGGWLSPIIAIVGIFMLLAFCGFMVLMFALAFSSGRGLYY